MPTLHPVSPKIERRALVAGAAWAVPAVMVAAPPAFAGASLCTVLGSVQVGANTTLNMRAVCTSQSQQPHPASIYENYGQVSLPSQLQICNCQQAPAWYRWRETDTLSNFQIEVDGVQVDENGPNQGYRAPFYLDTFGGQGGCQQYSLAYRTSLPRPTAADPDSVTITFTLQTGPSSTGPWTTIQTLTAAGTVWRTTNATVNFNSCTPQGVRSAATSGSTAASAPSGRGD